MSLFLIARTISGQTLIFVNIHAGAGASFLTLLCFLFCLFFVCTFFSTRLFCGSLNNNRHIPYNIQFFFILLPFALLFLDYPNFRYLSLSVDCTRLLFCLVSFYSTSCAWRACHSCFVFGLSNAVVEIYRRLSRKKNNQTTKLSLFY